MLLGCREPPGSAGGPGPLPAIPGRASRWQHKARDTALAWTLGPWEGFFPDNELRWSAHAGLSMPGPGHPALHSRTTHAPWSLTAQGGTVQPGGVAGGGHWWPAPWVTGLPRPPGPTWENWAKVRSASMGTCPSSSWQQSLCWGRRVGGAGGPSGQAACPPQPQTRPPALPRRPGAGAGHSRLGGVHGRGGVADVLGALEHAEGQAGQEVPRGQQAGHGPQLEASPLCWGGAGGGRSGAGWRGRRGWPGAGCGPGDPAQAPHPSGSGRRPPAAGFGPRGTHRSAPTARRPPGARGRRGWGTGPAAWSRPPSCRPGAQAGACPRPSLHPERPHPMGSALPPAGPGSLALQASHQPKKPATGRGFGGLLGGPRKSLLPSDLVCPPGGHGVSAGPPRAPVPARPASATDSHQVAISSAVYSTWGMGSPLGRVCSQSRPPQGGRAGSGREGPRLSAPPAVWLRRLA